jgi:hypothetical protein
VAPVAPRRACVGIVKTGWLLERLQV